MGYLAEEICKTKNVIENQHQANFANNINNLMNMVTANTNIVQKLTAANKSLTEKIKVTLEQSKVLTFLLQQNLSSDNSTPKVNSNINRYIPAPCEDNRENKCDPLVYCWTHGSKVEVGHNIWSSHWGCKTPKHQRGYTGGHIMGISTKNKYWKIENAKTGRFS